MEITVQFAMHNETYILETLEDAIEAGERIARAELYGITFSPEDAIRFAKAMPDKWRDAVKKAVFTTYINES